MAIRLFVSSLFIALTIYLGYIVERANFSAFISAYGLFFAIYFWLITRPSWTANDQRWWIGSGIALRVVLLFSIPNLSDDFYRFLWDGRLAAQGVHPFAHPPVYFVENQIELLGITPELYAWLNSPEYYTVYPPVCQGMFWLAAKLFPESISGGVLVLKVFLFLCELGVLFTLSNFKFQLSTFKSEKTSLISNLKFEKKNLKSGPPWCEAGPAVVYALNPLILLEITGNLHFEGAMLCFLLAGMVFLQQQRLLPAAVFWALATASKLVPLLFLPIIWVQLGFQRGLRFLLFFAGGTAVLFAPLLNWEILKNMAGSLNLYFQQFAFNASFYYVFKLIGKAWVTDPAVDVGRTLGPILGLVVFFGVWMLAVFSPRRHRGTEMFSAVQKENSVPLRLRGELLATPLLFASTLYLALATTVHPWYVTLPFGLSLLTRWHFPIVWTGVAALSYSHYDGGGFKENYWWIAVEYTLLFGFLVWEYLSRQSGGVQSFEDSPTK